MTQQATIISDGTPKGTQVLDGAGNPIPGVCAASFEIGPDGLGRISVLVDNARVEAQGELTMHSKGKILMEIRSLVQEVRDSDLPEDQKQYLIASNLRSPLTTWKFGVGQDVDGPTLIHALKCALIQAFLEDAGYEAYAGEEFVEIPPFPQEVIDAMEKVMSLPQLPKRVDA